MAVSRERMAYDDKSARNNLSTFSFQGMKNRQMSSSHPPESIFSNNYRDITLSGGPVRVFEYCTQSANECPSIRPGPPVLLLHGAMLDTAAFTWRHLMPELSRNRRVLAIDMPRHGASRPWPATTFLDQPRYESILTELLDALSIERASLIGLSMGGGVATGYALSRPSRVSSLVAINPGGLDVKRPWQLMTWLVLRCTWFLRWTARWLARSPSVLRQSVERGFISGAQTTDFDALMELASHEAKESARHGELVFDDWQIAWYGPWRMSFNYLPHLDTLKAPSLWVHGAKDDLIKEDVLRQAADTAPSSRFVSIPNAGHIASLDQPERVHEAIENFLNEAHC